MSQHSQHQEIHHTISLSKDTLDALGELLTGTASAGSPTIRQMLESMTKNLRVIHEYVVRAEKKEAAIEQAQIDMKTILDAVSRAVLGIPHHFNSTIIISPKERQI